VASEVSTARLRAGAWASGAARGRPGSSWAGAAPAAQSHAASRATPKPPRETPRFAGAGDLLDRDCQGGHAQIRWLFVVERALKDLVVRQTHGVVESATRFTVFDHQQEQRRPVQVDVEYLCEKYGRCALIERSAVHVHRDPEGNDDLRDRRSSSGTRPASRSQRSCPLVVPYRQLAEALVRQRGPRHSISPAGKALVPYQMDSAVKASIFR
jgi:hypothetical protein